MKKNPYFSILILVPLTVIALFFGAPSFAKDVIGKTSNNPTLLILGDSLSTAFGIEQSQGWVTLLTNKLQQDQYKIRVVNASISGETTQGGLQRLPSLLKKHKPAVVVVELGGNDGLRGLKLTMIRSNLQRIIEKIKAIDASILLAGIRLPPNYGQVYTDQFYQNYIDLAKQEKVSLIPFILEGIATNRSLMQADNIHPNEKAQPIVFENVWGNLKPLLKAYSKL